MNSDTWRNQLRTWADRYARDFIKKPGILGVVIGGSLARGQEWRHSDLELGILVEDKDTALPYFNVDHGRGVEVIQLVRPQLEEQISQAEAGDLSPVNVWPIQLWKCRIIHDPSGVLGRFKRQFDSGLFNKELAEKRLQGARLNIKNILAEARDHLAQNRPAAALDKSRWAMNDAILALHWACGELPRSQNRTDSRLRLLCKKHGHMSFHPLYREVFALSDTNRVIKNTWPLVKTRVLEITRLWGDDTRNFFVHAVDSEFKWRQNAGILTVYRLYLPLIGSIQGSLDDAEWAEENRDLLAFLGLADLDNDLVSQLMDRIEESCKLFAAGSLLKDA
ncbi:MAG: hypothetical protein NTV93_13535 [Verrucomicrobia bacterium]|nr:hypothetical protein [Verrucomicrobiota bacterium]